MKKLRLLIALSIFLHACKKDTLETAQTQSTFKAETTGYLKQKLDGVSFNTLDIINSTEGRFGENGFVEFIREKSTPGKYLVVTRSGNNWNANYVTLGSDKESGNKSLLTENLDHSTFKVISFKNGKIVSSSGYLEKSMADNGPKMMVIGEDLPPVEIQCTLYGQTNQVALLSLYWILNQNPTYTNVYIDPTIGGGGSGGTGFGPAFYIDNPDIAYEIEYDDSDDRLKADLKKLLDCFGTISDNGATFSMTICADIPINGRPNQLINGLNPGHAFITLTKAGSGGSVTQSFGFYPDNGPKSLTTLPVTSAIKIDGNHEYNASLTMNLTSSQFETVLSRSEMEAMAYYQLLGFNCTDYAVAVFNSVRGSSPLSVNNSSTTGGKTPGTLYNAINSIKNGNSSEASSATVGKFTSGTAKGECP